MITTILRCVLNKLLQIINCFVFVIILARMVFFCKLATLTDLSYALASMRSSSCLVKSIGVELLPGDGVAAVLAPVCSAPPEEDSIEEEDEEAAAGEETEDPSHVPACAQTCRLPHVKFLD